MKSYFIQRLKPFFISFILLEILFLCGKVYQSFEGFDFAPWELVKVLGILLLTASIAFLYMMLPYVLYLVFLPAKKQNGRLDKIVTTGVYTVFIYATLFQGASTQIFWDEFQAAFNFIAVDYLVYTTEVIDNIYQSYPVNWILLGLLAATLVHLVFDALTLYTVNHLNSVLKFRCRLGASVCCSWLSILLCLLLLTLPLICRVWKYAKTIITMRRARKELTVCSALF